MRILWITNIPLPDVCNKIGIKSPNTGGWLHSILDSLREEAISFGVTSLYNGDTLQHHIINEVDYFLLPSPKNNFKYNRSLEKYWREIDSIFNPDIVEIHGTEFAHSLSYIKLCPNRRFIIEIQGLVSVIARYYYSGISFRGILKNITIRDILRRDTLFHSYKNMKQRGIIEKEIIQRVSDAIGRTTWDESHVKALNPKINYHYCPRTLRSSFYLDSWNINDIETHSIFLSQAYYPIKGLHQVLKATNIIKKKYPNIKIYVGGEDITRGNKLLNKIKISGYGLYVKQLIRQYSLETIVIFLGSLKEKEIKERFLKSHLFIAPSSIENSPNSLAEAQILGVPVIASYVGGVPDMIAEGRTGFMYRFEEVEVLAFLMDKLFSMNSEKLIELSQNERKEAHIRHNPQENRRRMVDIYTKIFKNK